MTFDRSLFMSYNSNVNATVEMGTKSKVLVAGLGDILLKLWCASSFVTRKLNNVLQIPSFRYSMQLLVQWIEKE